jgi:hypothetical protein
MIGRGLREFGRFALMFAGGTLLAANAWSISTGNGFRVPVSWLDPMMLAAFFIPALGTSIWRALKA